MTTLYDRVNATEPVTGKNIMILVPNANAAIPYNPAVPTPLIIFFVGVGGDETALVVPGALTDGCRDAMLNAGWIIVGVGDTVGWGSNASVQCYWGTSLYLYANYNISNIGLWAGSMGGLAGLISLQRQAIQHVVGWLGTYPICSLSAAYTGTGGMDFSSNINTAYGITGSGGNTYALLTAGHDPLTFSGPQFHGCPMRFYASPDDTVVGIVQNSDAMSALVANYCRESEVIVCSGEHGDPSMLQPTDYVNFFTRCFTSPVVPSSRGRI